MKKIVIVIIFIFAMISLNACKSTRSCTSVEKQYLNKANTPVVLTTEEVS